MPPSNTAEWSVSELAGALKRTLEDSFGHVRLRGEISGYRGPHSSGHVYFSLKDQSARIDAVIWKGSFSRMRFKPEEGLEVIATGRITTFPGKSAYQIIVESLEPAGVGALMALIEERKRKFAAEGLFDADKKRALPYLPETIGVVTSPTGAVIRDILHRLEDRFPRRVLVWPVRVQGESSAAEVAAAIRGFNALPPGGVIPRPDVLIVARGGGSIEDLWGFNEEVVVRAVADGTIPLISAVGHETDWTLIDHVADVRAPTPTGAAEMAVPVRMELMGTLGNLSNRHGEALLRLFERRRTELRSAARALPQPDAFLSTQQQKLDLATAHLRPALAGNLRSFEIRLAQMLHKLQRFSPAERLAGIRARFEAIGHRPAEGIRRFVSQKQDALRQTGERLHVARGAIWRAERVRIEQGRELVRRGAERLSPAALRAIGRKAERLQALVSLFDSLNYKSVLARGYALIRDDKARPVHFATAVAAGQNLSVEFSDGTIAVTVNGTEGNTEVTSKPRKTATVSEKPLTDGPKRQGSLFDN